MSRVRWSLVLLIVLALVVAACQPAATSTPTPRPPTEVPATEVPPTEAVAEAATEEATEAATEEAVVEATEVATEEAVVEAATEEATEVAMVVEAATEEAVVVAEATEAATEEAVVVEATEVATEEAVVVEATEVATEEAVVVEPTEEATVEPTVAPTEEATPEPVAEAAGAITFEPGQSLVIGVAVGLSGEGIAPLGVDIQRGVELALEDRPTVTVGGAEFAVTLDAQDDLCAAEGGQAVANRFSADATVIGVVGPMCSSACRAAAPIFDAAGYTTISPSCTAPDLTASGYTSFNRAVVSDAFQGRIAAEYIYNVLGLTKIATIHDGSPYGEGLVNVVTARFTELGGEVVASDAVTVGDTDFRGLLDDIAQQEPELIYFGGFPAEAARIIEQRADAGLEDVPFMGADGIRGTEVLELAGASSEGVYATSAVAASSDALASFLERYVATYGEEPPAPYHANGYDAANLFLDAVEATGTVDASGNLVLDRAAIAEYIRSVENFQGLTGVLNAEGNGETSVSDIGIYQATDGDFALISVGRVVDGEVVIEDAPAPEAPVEATPEATPAAEVTPEATASS
ncbi:MAG: branched-chain amino acid ABC transporter substrate-binding protein [Chloroflexi bacterium]|uniref:branched-chain amino acid ABC transporter substrate-binding protein n=1 Tax=Candidatus Flexifilum breve TaxID=3140694 RepID=UPI0031371F1A|nr:branched-chain amino acid ABC transporter substrate-binding protein [Chloroflexota bacterium]